MGIKDKVIIITGAGQGIGAACAVKLAENGAKVIIADLNEEKAKNTAKKITDSGHKADAFKTDVSKENSVQNLVEVVIKKYERIDVLINFAAVFSTIKTKPIENIDKEEWDNLMAVNLGGIFLCCKMVVPYMKNQKQGKIINISSASVFMGKPYYIHYVTSKAGVVGFTRALARELGDYNINVNCVTPGYTKTEVPRKTTSSDQLKEIISRQCIKRIGTPEDILGVILLLASEDSDFLSGQTINVDGGDSFH